MLHQRPVRIGASAESSDFCCREKQPYKQVVGSDDYIWQLGEQTALVSRAAYAVEVCTRLLLTMYMISITVSIKIYAVATVRRAEAP